MKKIYPLLFLLFVYYGSKAQSNLLWGHVTPSTGWDLEILTTDPVGNIICTGNFNGTIDLDPGVGVSNVTAISYPDAYILKLDPSGNFLWGKSFGGSGTDEGHYVTTDANGNIYVCGFFDYNVDLDPGPGTFSVSSAYQGNLFIIKLDPLGNFLWAKTVETQSYYRNSIKVDPNGNILVSGDFGGTPDFDPGPGFFYMTSTLDDFFVLKLDPLGNFLWAKQIGGNNFDLSWDMAVDPSGNVNVTGNFVDTVDFDPGPGTFTLVANPSQNTAYLLKLNANGNFMWANSTQGTGLAFNRKIATDASGNVYTTGRFRDTVDFNSGPGVYKLYTDSCFFCQDAFITKHNSSGVWQWTKQYRSKKFDEGISICTDPGNNIYVTGLFGDTLLCASGYTLFPPHSNNTAFISKLDPNGNTFWVGQLPGGNNSSGLTIATDLSGNIISNGTFQQNIDVDPGPLTNTLTLSPNGLYRIKLSAIVGVEEKHLENESEIIYPNPTSSSFNLNLNSLSQIVITDILGQEILNKNFDSGKQTIDISDQSLGIYFVKLISEGEQEVVKLIKE